jgi:mono/diheme cytochrome c family protein
MTRPPAPAADRRLAVATAVGALLGLAAPAAAALFIYGGVYDIGADAPHTKPVLWLIERLRDRSIIVRAAAVAAPADLASPGRIAAGGHLYGELCVSCHLAAGMARTGLSRGLYPRPPQLAYGTDLTPAQEFWIIKHGIKLTGMPAWGRSRSDAEIWDLVAFVRKMPDLEPGQPQGATN